MKTAVIAIHVIIAALVAAPALAADMALKAPPPLAQVPEWDGCYVGGTLGGAWGRSDYSGTPTGDFPIAEPTVIPNLTAITTGALKPSSAIGGGEIGCNRRFSSVVLGLEVDFSGWNLSKSSVLTGPGDPAAPGSTLSAATSENSHWLATVRPRLGITDSNWLFYVTGGVAFANVSFAQSVTFNVIPSSTMAGSVTSTLTGWTVGGGVGYRFAPDWSLKAEYLYVSFPGQNVNEVNPAFPTFTATTSNRLSTSIFRVGLDYQFSNLPVATH
jgi:outer membrane immunogenic protein